MKKAILVIVTTSLALLYLMVLPTNIMDSDDTLNDGQQFSSIVPAKPPKVPPKE